MVDDRRQRRLSTRSAFTGIMIGMALAAISQTLVSTALPTIVGDLGGYDQLSWVVSAYLLTSAVVVPFAGALADRYGTSRLFQLAIVVFAAGSALAAVSTSMGLLIAARSIQGLGGGAIMTLAFTLVGHIVAPRERGRYQGYIASLFAVTSVLGPLVGGFFVDHLTWRLAFVTNVVLSGVALVVFRRRRLVDVTGPGGRLDLPGSALLVVALVSTMLVMMWGGQRHAWTSAVIISLVLIAIGSFVLFVVCERRATDPIVPLDLFTRPVVPRVRPAQLPVGHGDVRRDRVRADVPADRPRRGADAVGAPAGSADGLHPRRQHRRRPGDVAHRSLPQSRHHRLGGAAGG